MAYVVIMGDELHHHGIKGMKWGVRRFQNSDGSLKPAGRKRYTDYKPAIKEYRDSYDKASSMNDAADAKWRDVQAARKNLGRTAIGRTIASARNKTDAAKKYNRMYDEWSKMQDDADEQWRDADEKYKNTGGNRLTRIANNIRYDTKFGSAKSGEKRQLSDEEKAARNAKIKKAAIGVGVAALAAAGTYAAVKYNNKTMSEAKQIMSDTRKKAVDHYVEKADKVFKQQEFAASMQRQFEAARQGDTEPAKEWARAEGRYRTELNKILKDKNTYDNIASRNIADRSVQRRAQKELIKRDAKLAKRSATESVKKALRRPTMDKDAREFADSTTRSAAALKVRQLVGTESKEQRDKRLRGEAALEYIRKLNERR